MKILQLLLAVPHNLIRAGKNMFCKNRCLLLNAVTLLNDDARYNNEK